MKRFAAMKDVQIMLGREEFALNMAPRGRFAAMKDAHHLQRREEFVFDMVLSKQENYAATKDAQRKLIREDVATDTVIRAKVIIRMMHQILQLYPLRKHQLQKWIPNLLLYPHYVYQVSVLMIHTTKIQMMKMKVCVVIKRRNILSRRNMTKRMI